MQGAASTGSAAIGFVEATGADSKSTAGRPPRGGCNEARTNGPKLPRQMEESSKEPRSWEPIESRLTRVQSDTSDGVRNDFHAAGSGLPARITDETFFSIDALPCFEKPRMCAASQG